MEPTNVEVVCRSGHRFTTSSDQPGRCPRCGEPRRLEVASRGLTTESFLKVNAWVRDCRAVLPRHKTRVWRKRDLNETLGMVWHQALSSGSVEGVAAYHVGPNHISNEGLPALSYTFFIEPDGHTLLCNDLEDVTYSQGDRTKPGDENALYVAVCFSGNFDAPGYTGSDKVTAAQMYSGLRLWLVMREMFGWSEGGLYGHYHFGKPACPGTMLSRVIEGVRDAAKPESHDYDFSTIEGRQAALMNAGFYKGKLDGIWGKGSREALMAFQRSNDIAVDGLWGPETEQAMRHV